MNKKIFYEKVYQVVRLIPRGRVTSYGAIAAYLGMKSSSRMVGYAMSASHAAFPVPAHRVVNRNGLLTGKFHFENPETMSQLLTMEGVSIVNDQVQNFKNLFWDPATEMDSSEWNISMLF